MKKFLMIFAMVLSFSIWQQSTVHAFSDINVKNEQGRAIESLAAQKIINGYSDGTFKPSNNVTRGQAAKMLAGALKLDVENVTDPQFGDVPKSHPYYSYIAALANKGIISTSNAKYSPSQPMTRGQIAKILDIGFNLNTPIATPFTDIKGTGFEKHIESLYGSKITTGVTNVKFGTNDKVTRGQLAVFMQRIQKIKEPNALNGVWEGIYYAIQGETSLKLTVDQAIATFEFGPTKNNPSVPKGLYVATAKHDATRDFVQFEGLKWVAQPSAYRFVSLDGVMTANGQLSGFVDGNIKYHFVLSNAKSTNNKLSVAGIWEGQYINNFGETGVTLNLEEEYGTFSFYNLPGKTNNKKGSFAVDVDVTNDGFVTLLANDWIEQPSNYRTVNIYGVLSRKGYFKGYMDGLNNYPFLVKLQ